MSNRIKFESVNAYQIAALSFAILAFIVSFVALLTPSWQVVYARELQQWVQSGLWMNCQTRPSGMVTCAYTFTQHDYELYMSPDLNYLRTPPFYTWQRHLLAIYLLAQFLAFFSFTAFCCSFHPTTVNLSAICFVGFVGLSFLLHAGATLTFLVFSQMVEYRFYHVSVSGIYEKHVGYSWYVEVFAVGFYMISLICAIIHMVRARFQRKSTSYNDQMSSQEYFGNGYLDPFETRLAMRDLPQIPKAYQQYGYH
ncbi:hypothetical protein M3Y98_01125500 [Aphelenchoides besseyi]|nr:hypothetical protein M3Y98_01125500 [Aphelenchoides besseyi]KAI6210535.1 hypothetical protein M3Y96_00338500 [Aphelenchoides besseyi]